MSEQRNTAQELGDFLRTRRAALSPAESGVPTYGSPRRVPGLRREEVAQLAGVSVNYYTPIEDLTQYDKLTAKVQVMTTPHSLVTTEIAHARGFVRYPW